MDLNRYTLSDIVVTQFPLINRSLIMYPADGNVYANRPWKNAFQGANRDAPTGKLRAMRAQTHASIIYEPNLTFEDIMHKGSTYLPRSVKLFPRTLFRMFHPQINVARMHYYIYSALHYYRERSRSFKRLFA